MRFIFIIVYLEKNCNTIKKKTLDRPSDWFVLKFSPSNAN